MKRQDPQHQPKPRSEAQAVAPALGGAGAAIVGLIEFVQARLKMIVRLCLVVLALLIGVDAIPGAIGKEHAHTAAERLPGFWAIFGFVGCVVIILVSKWFGHAGIMQREDYYDE